MRGCHRISYCRTSEPNLAHPPVATRIAMSKQRIKVLTLNLWNVDHALDRRTALLASGLQRLRPDIVCLQEVSRNPATQQIRSEQVAASCGFPHHLFSGFGEAASQSGHSVPAGLEGLAILSKFPALRQNTIALPSFPGDFPRQALLAEIAVNERRIGVVTTHLAYPPTFSREREAQMRQVLDGIDQFTSHDAVDAIILTGDFNDECHAPSILAILHSRYGFRDAYATCRPEDRGATFASSNPYAGPGFEPGLRIDFIFATPNLQPLECTPVFDGNSGLDPVSDHFGVMCEFALD